MKIKMRAQQKEPVRKSQARKWRAKLDTVCLINQGYKRDDIISRLVEDYEYAESSALHIYYDALTEAKRTCEDYIREASKVNIQRIIGIIDQCYADKRYADALRAIDMLNKMGGFYAPEQHEVTTSTEPIKITFE